jgi:hypothetical protein
VSCLTRKNVIAQYVANSIIQRNQTPVDTAKDAPLRRNEHDWQNIGENNEMHEMNFTFLIYERVLYISLFDFKLKRRTNIYG